MGALRGNLRLLYLQNMQSLFIIFKIDGIFLEHQTSTSFTGLHRQMLHEILLALLGHPGSIIQEEIAHESASHVKHGVPATTFRVPEGISFLTPTERAAINRVVHLGSIYRELRQFVRPTPLVSYKDYASSTVSSPRPLVTAETSLYMRALKAGVEELLDEYSGRVAEVEKDAMADPSLTLACIHAGIREVSFAT